MIIDVTLSSDPIGAALLAEAMSEISEDCYCAGWLMGLEYTLWHMVQGGDRHFGNGEVQEQEIVVLKKLHEECGGWIVWHDDESGAGADPEKWGERFVPTDVWLKMYAEQQALLEKMRAECEKQL